MDVLNRAIMELETLETLVLELVMSKLKEQGLSL